MSGVDCERFMGLFSVNDKGHDLLVLGTMIQVVYCVSVECFYSMFVFKLVTIGDRKECLCKWLRVIEVT